MPSSTSGAAFDPDGLLHLEQRRAGAVDRGVGRDDAEDLHVFASRDESHDHPAQDLLHGLEGLAEVAAVTDADLAQGELDAAVVIDADSGVVLLDVVFGRAVEYVVDVQGGRQHLAQQCPGEVLGVEVGKQLCRQVVRGDGLELGHCNPPKMCSGVTR